MNVGIQTSTRTQIESALAKAQQSYHDLLAEVPEDEWEKPSGNPAWNIRQMMYHMTTALKFLPQDVKFIRRGSQLKPPAWLFNWLNKWYNRWAARGQSKTSLAAEYDHNQARVLALLADLSDEELLLAMEYPDIGGNMHGGKRTITDIYFYAAAHVSEHIEDVRYAYQKRIEE